MEKHAPPGKLLLTLILLCALHLAAAQVANCGLESPSVSSRPTAEVPPACFDAAEVFNNCIPIYIQVNLHFFTNASCGDTVQQTQQTQQTVISELAETIINYNNEKAAENPEHWPHQQPPVLVCNPIRYVLKGVYIHCFEGADLGNIHSIQAKFGVMTSTHINMYIADFPGSHSGVSNAVGGNCGGIESTFSSDFNHEIGHMLNLEHANGNYNGYDDGCPDTNPILHSWDKNCDGKLTGTENFRLCWAYIGDPDNTFDDNKNGVPDCRDTFPCTPSPCCSWAFQNNNMMLSAGSYQQSFTTCQVKRMLTNLSTEKCGFVAQIGGSPPPNAFITQTPTDLRNTTRCSECLILGASTNETSHHLQIYRVEGTNPKPVYDSGWVESPAQDFCFTTDSKSTSSTLILAPNTPYRAVLTVRDTLGFVHLYDYIFTTPLTDECEETN